MNQNNTFVVLLKEGGIHICPWGLDTKMKTKRIFFVCFYMYGIYRPTREFFHSYGDVTITGEGLQILTYVRHSLSLSGEGS